MAAITYKFGVQSDVNQLEHKLADDSVGLEGLGDASVADAALAQSHAALLNMVYLRRACEEVLQGRVIAVTFEHGNVWLNLDRALPQEPAWNPPTQSGLHRFKLTSWTSKMGTPSFSLPAGPPVIGGACPGATAGMSVVPASAQKRQLQVVQEITGRPVEIAKAICEHCYAEGGQYSTGQVQYAQLMRFAWTQQAVDDGSFAQVMDWAVKNANFYLGGKGKVKTDDLDENGDPVYVPVRGERDGRKYFRVHDSGDFFSLPYLAAWREVAEANPDVIFWAPSRIWAGGESWIRAVDAINGRPRNNLIIRPSAYSINEPGLRDLGTGWAAGTTVYGDKHKPQDMSGDVITPNSMFDWDCKAYQTDNDKVTCRDAEAPDGERGCRACWKHPDMVVDYTLH